MIPRLWNKTKLSKERMRIKKEQIQRKKAICKLRTFLLFSVGLKLLALAREALKINRSRGTVG